MAGDDFDPEAIDRLLRKLGEKPRAPGTATPPAPEVVGVGQGTTRPASRWTNVRVVMPPSRPTPSAWKRIANAGSAIRLPSLLHLPALPDFRRLIQVPGPVATVRMWVGLAATYSVSMTFWPYPKTYFLGMAMYLLSLGLLVVAGAWGARLSWDGRLGAAHTIAIGTVIWSILLVTVEAVHLI